MIYAVCTDIMNWLHCETANERIMKRCVLKCTYLRNSLNDCEHKKIAINYVESIM